VEEAAASAESLEVQAERLVEAISQFKLPSSTTDLPDMGRTAPLSVVRSPARKLAG
jgi:hypothetical protein